VKRRSRNRPLFTNRHETGQADSARDAAGWSYGIAEHFTKHGFLFCVDAHRDGKRFIVKADDLLTAFLSLERDAIAPKEANENATR